MKYKLDNFIRQILETLTLNVVIRKAGISISESNELSRLKIYLLYQRFYKNLKQNFCI